MSRLVNYVVMNNFNNHLLDTDLLRVFDFGRVGNHRIYRIVDAMEDVTIGAVEYAKVARGLEIRIGLNSAFRNQGLASNIINDVVDKIGKAFSNTKYLVCYVDVNNDYSLKMVRKSGFYPSDNDIPLEEGYCEYLLLNPHLQIDNQANDNVNFVDCPDEEALFKIELRGVKAHKVRIKRTYDGMEIMTDLQDDKNCNIIRFVKTLTEMIYHLGPLYPSSEYFTFRFNLGPNVHPMNYIKLFSLYGYQLNTLSSTDSILVFKCLNPEYHINVRDVLTMGLIKEKNND